MKIDLSKKAEKFLDKLSDRQSHRILTALWKLPAGDVKPMQGEDGFRLRVGDWRILYDIVDNVIIVREIGSRGDIYK